MNKEKSAKGLKGFIMFDPIRKDTFFRVYHNVQTHDFTDYTLYNHAFKVEIIDDDAMIKHISGEEVIDYSDQTLGYEEK